MGMETGYLDLELQIAQEQAVDLVLWNRRNWSLGRSILPSVTSRWMVWLEVEPMLLGHSGKGVGNRWIDASPFPGTVFTRLRM